MLILDDGNEDKVIECCKKILDWQTGYKYLNLYESGKLKPFLELIKSELIKSRAFKEAAKVAIKLKQPISDAFERNTQGSEIQESQIVAFRTFNQR